MDSVQESKEIIMMHPDVKLSIAAGERFFGRGTVALLKEIKRCGNVREACGVCGFSYSKGWTILRRCEHKTGYPIVQRQAGGKAGGSARVTEEGLALLEIYEELERELNETAERRFRELLRDYQLTGEMLK